MQIKLNKETYICTNLEQLNEEWEKLKQIQLKHIELLREPERKIRKLKKKISKFDTGVKDELFPEIRKLRKSYYKVLKGQVKLSEGIIKFIKNLNA